MSERKIASVNLAHIGAVCVPRTYLTSWHFDITLLILWKNNVFFKYHTKFWTNSWFYFIYYIFWTTSDLTVFNDVTGSSEDSVPNRGMMTEYWVLDVDGIWKEAVVSLEYTSRYGDYMKHNMYRLNY
jgi:hypothetical protein